MQFRATLGGSTIIFLNVYDFFEKNMYVAMQFEAIWGNLGQFGVIWGNLGQFGAIWGNLGQFHSLQFSQFHAICGNLRQFKAI